MTVISVQKPAPELISTEAFWDRFTAAEGIDFEVACQHDSGSSNALKKDAAKLRIFRRTADVNGYVNLAKNKVQNFVTSLESPQNGITILAVGRAAAILSAPITDAEEYR